MKLLSLFLCFLSFRTIAQKKTVKVENENIYVNFYYKLRQTKYKLNDSTYYLCKTIDHSTFFLEKYLNRNRIERVKYKAVVAKDSLNVSELRSEGRKSKLVKTKELYYVAVRLR